MKRFVWIPGEGIDLGALGRLRSNFKRPNSPMGEAWFMGETRHFFHELRGPIERLPVESLQKPLEEIASGTSSFGPMREWTDWYHYLLGQSLPRWNEGTVNVLLELLMTSFMALYPSGVQAAPYKQFRDDALLTLGRCLMDSRCWQGSDFVVGSCLHRSNCNPRSVWRWWDASGDFSASMFFCLKYLPVELLGEWLASVLAIRSPQWRAQVLVWAVGAHEVLKGNVLWPSEFELDAYPSIAWEWSHCLNAEAGQEIAVGEAGRRAFLPVASRSIAVQTFRDCFTAEEYLAWIDSIDRVQYLAEELGDIPLHFERLYLQTPGKEKHARSH